MAPLQRDTTLLLDEERIVSVQPGDTLVITALLKTDTQECGVFRAIRGGNNKDLPQYSITMQMI